MNEIRSADYGETETVLSRHPLTTAMAYRMPTVAGKTIVDLTRADLLHNSIAQIDHSGLAPTWDFTQAANATFHQLEEANPAHKWEGQMHIGAVAAALLIIWRESREAVMGATGLSDDDLDARLTAGETASDILTKFVDEHDPFPDLG
jgi:hypothetical protein